MFRQYRLHDFRFRLVVLVYAITILGILIVGSAESEYRNQQILGMILGSVAMIVLSLLDYRVLTNCYWLLYAGNLILLLLVAFTPLGVEVNNARRWLNVGVTRIQPSELTKLVMILFYARFFTKYRDYINSWRVIIPAGILLAVPLYLVI